MSLEFHTTPVNGRECCSTMNDDKRKIRVLLVEDSPLVAEQVLELLQDQNNCAVPVAVVSTEREALLAARDLNPDLIILDLHLKQGTGFGVLKELSSDAHPPKIAVLTNYALPKYRDLACLRGADYFLDKSRDFERLPDIISQLDNARADLPH